MPPEPTAVFVYGTLKRGQCRQHCWPRVPQSVQPGVVQGALYDLGPYPALVPGPDRVAGEVYVFRPEDLPATLKALDAIEVYRGRPDDLYTRCVAECQLAGGGVIRAYLYRYARLEELGGRQPLRPGAGGLVRWPATASS